MDIGERIGAKEKVYYKGHGISDLSVCTAWFPMIEVGGRMVFLKSNSSPTGKLEADSLGEALTLAMKHRDLCRRKLQAEAERSAKNVM